MSEGKPSLYMKIKTADRGREKLLWNDATAKRSRPIEITRCTCAKLVARFTMARCETLGTGPFTAIFVL